MLIDEFLPVFEFRECHAIVVRAPAARVHAALRTADFAESAVVRTLLVLRGLPAAVLRGRSGPLSVGPVRLRDFEAHGFRVLAEQPPRELLIGLAGKFWTPAGGLLPLDARSFREPLPPGTARAAWNFAIEAAGQGTVLLTTETRIQCPDAESLRKFRVYWFVVRPWSGWIRRCLLRSIRKEAESGAML